MKRIPAETIPGIDLGFRPATYFWPMRLETHLLARVKGAERQAALRRLIAAGPLADVPEFLALSALDDADRKAMGEIHPRFMGGEYLPDLRDNEVEIMRITLASTLQDATSVYARCGKHRIHYRIVDEYGGETFTGKATRSSTRPLSLGELETFLTGAFDLFGILEINFAEDGYEPDEVRAFATATSAFYPQAGALYARRIEEWVRERRAWHESYEDAESESEAGTPETSAG